MNKKMSSFLISSFNFQNPNVAILQFSQIPHMVPFGSLMHESIMGETSRCNRHQQLIISDFHPHIVYIVSQYHVSQGIASWL